VDGSASWEGNCRRRSRSWPTAAGAVLPSPAAASARPGHVP